MESAPLFREIIRNPSLRNRILSNLIIPSVCLSCSIALSRQSLPSVATPNLDGYGSTAKSLIIAAVGASSSEFLRTLSGSEGRSVRDRSRNADRSCHRGTFPKRRKSVFTSAGLGPAGDCVLRPDRCEFAELQVTPHSIIRA